MIATEVGLGIKPSKQFLFMGRQFGFSCFTNLFVSNGLLFAGFPFSIDPQMWVAFESRTLAVVHSHPDGPAAPTAADMLFQVESDKIIKQVCEQMKADKTKHRVTFYYLMAEASGKVSAIA